MPYSSRQEKLDASQKWRERNYKPAYMRWLYERRMVPKRQAEVMRAALKRLGSTEKLTRHEIQEIALGALEWCRQHDQTVGNRFDHTEQKGYYVDNPRKR